MCTVYVYVITYIKQNKKTQDLMAADNISSPQVICGRKQLSLPMKGFEETILLSNIEKIKFLSNHLNGQNDSFVQLHNVFPNSSLVY